MNTSRRTLLLGSAASVAGAVLQGGLAGRASAGAAAAAPRTTVYRGVNLSGAEFTADAAHLPGLVDRDDRYPTRDDLRYIARRGHTMVRVPVRWERLQPTLIRDARLHPAADRLGLEPGPFGSSGGDIDVASGSGSTTGFDSRRMSESPKVVYLRIG